MNAKSTRYLNNILLLFGITLVLYQCANACGARGPWLYYRLLPFSHDLSSHNFSTDKFMLSVTFSMLYYPFSLLIFFVYAYFLPSVYDTLGAHRFLWNRLLRIGAPIVFVVLVLHPALIYGSAILMENAWATGSFFRDMLTERRFFLWALPIFNHLLIYSLVYLVYKKFFSSWKPPQCWKTFPKNRLLILCVFCLSLAPISEMFFKTQFSVFFPNPIDSRVFFFLAGLLAYRFQWLERITDKQTMWSYLLFIFSALSMMAISVGLLKGNYSPIESPMHALVTIAPMSLSSTALSVSLAMALVVFFQKRLNRETALSRALSESVYVLYVIHPLAIVPIVYLVSLLELSSGLSFVILAPLALVSSFLISVPIHRIISSCFPRPLAQDATVPAMQEDN